GLGIGQVMQYARGKHEVEACIFLHQLRVYGFDAEVTAATKAFPRRLDIVCAQVEAMILHHRQRFEDVRRAATDVENTVAHARPDVALDVKAPASLHANEPRK